MYVYTDRIVFKTEWEEGASTVHQMQFQKNNFQKLIITSLIIITIFSMDPQFYIMIYRRLNNLIWVQGY